MTLSVSLVNRKSVVGELDSVVCSDVTMPEWRGTVDRFANRASSTARDAQLLNAGGNAASAGEINAVFTLPPGATSVAAFVSAASTGATAIKLLIYAADMATTLASQRYSLTGATSLCELDCSGLVAGTLYGLAIQVNDLGQQARVFVNSVQVKPIGGTGLFASSFRRIRVTAQMLGATSYAAAWTNGLYLAHNRIADATLITDADRIAVECYTDSDSATQTAFLLEGRALGMSPAMPNLEITIAEQVLAANSHMRRVTVRAHSYALPGKGGFFRALYVPATASAAYAPSHGPCKMAVVGDSISCGYAIADQPLNSWVAALRTRYPGTILLDAGGGRALHDDLATVAAQEVVALQLAAVGVGHIWLALSVNDYYRSYWTAAAFGAAYASLLDVLHAVIPGATVFCQSFRLANEAANGAGSTFDLYGTQIQTAANARFWAQYVDGRSEPFPGTADMIDGIHPTLDGHGKYTQGAFGALASAGIL